MQMVTIVIFSVLFAVATCRPDTYGDEFDDIDVDEVLSNPRLVDSYLHCAKTGQRCTPEALKAKELLPEALSSKCAKCTEKQKTNSYKGLEWLIKNRPDDFLELEAMYDPNHQFRKDFEAQLNERGLHLPAL